jgi:hypothetical protein
VRNCHWGWSRGRFLLRLWSHWFRHDVLLLLFVVLRLIKARFIEIWFVEIRVLYFILCFLNVGFV